MPSEMRSSPPMMETEQEQDELTARGGQAELEAEGTSSERVQTDLVHVTTISWGISTPQPLVFHQKDGA